MKDFLYSIRDVNIVKKWTKSCYIVDGDVHPEDVSGGRHPASREARVAGRHQRATQVNAGRGKYCNMFYTYRNAVLHVFRELRVT